MSDYDKSSYWFEGAEYDLQTARAMLETKRYLYVGFMCHQVAEKSLKGVLVSRKPEEELPYIHKLIRLANLSGISDEMSEEQLRTCIHNTQYAAWADLFPPYFVKLSCHTQSMPAKSCLIWRKNLLPIRHFRL